MALATWWDGDVLPGLIPLHQFEIKATDTIKIITSVTELEEREVSRRLQEGHQPYLVFLEYEPVAYGWVATKEASIGECDINISLAAGERYLWDFKTLPQWRGLGIYPYLLQGILRQERKRADRFWILHAPENQASAAGIRKAGFQSVDEVSFTSEHRVSSYALTGSPRALMGANLLGVPWSDRVPTSGLAPCWSCHIQVQQETSCACSASHQDGHQKTCTC